MTTISSRLLDSMAVLLGTAVVLSVLDIRFTDRSYLVVGLTPVVMAIALSWWLSRFDHGGWLYAMVQLLLYAPLGALLALQDPGDFIIPALPTMGRVLGETATAPVELVSTLPPVDPSGTLLLVPFAIGYLVGGIGAWLALGTRSVFGPVVPVLGGLSATIYISTAAPNALVLRSLLLAGGCLWWSALRAQRLDRAAPASPRAWMRPIGAAVLISLVCGVVSSVVPVQEQSDRVVLRGREAERVENLPDPYLLYSSDKRPLLRATGVPSGTPVRFAALDSYDGQAWVAATGSSAPFQRIGSTVRPLFDGPQTSVRIQIRSGYESDWLPTVGELTGLDLDYTDGRTQLDQVRYNQVTRTALVLGGVDPRDDYELNAVIGVQDLAESDEAAKIQDDQRQLTGRFVDGYLDAFAGTARTPMQQLGVFMDYLRENGVVRIEGGSPQTPSALGKDFLGATRPIGTPHQYGALVALVASRLDVPARLVVGAYPDRKGRVSESDVESWVEVQVADGSWRIVRQSVYLGKTSESAPQAQEPAATPREYVRDDERSQPGPEPETSTSARLPDDSTVATILGWSGAAVAGLALLLLLAAPLMKLVRRRRRSRARSWSAVYAGGWQEVLDAATDTGRGISQTLGRVPQARLLGQGLTLARSADIAVFAPAAPSDQQRQEFWHDTQVLRRTLQSQVPWWRRTWSYFTPASLIVSWTRERSD